jgi:hypothetical protein
MVLECHLILFVALIAETGRPLMSSNLAWVGEQQYALWAWHMTTPRSFLVINGSVNPNVDIFIDMPQLENALVVWSLWLCTNILSTTQDMLWEGKWKGALLLEDLCIITLHSILVRKHVTPWHNHQLGCRAIRNCTLLTSPDGTDTQIALGRKVIHDYGPSSDKWIHCTCGTMHCSCVKEEVAIKWKFWSVKRS